MADKTTKVTTVLDTNGAERVKQDFAEIGQAVKNYGAAGEGAAERVALAFKNVEQSDERLTRKITEGRLVTEKDGKAILQQFEVLQVTLEQTFGSIEKAPAEIQAAFAKSQAQMNRTVSTVRDLSDVVDDQKGKLKEGGESWTGLGDAANKAAGKFGGALGVFGLVIAALKEGFEIGKRIAIWLGADWKLVDEAVDRLQSKSRILFKDILDGASATAGIVKNLVTGNWKELGKSVDEARDAALKFQKDGSDALTKYGAEWDRLHPSIKQVEQAQKDAAEAEKKAAEEARKHAEEQKRLKESLDRVTESLKKNAEELAKQTGIAHDAELATISSASQLGYYERSLQSAQAALEAQKQKVAETVAMWGEGSLAVKAATEEQRRLELAVQSAQQRVDDESASLKSSQSAMSSAESAVKSLKEKKKELTEEEKKAKTAIDAGTTASTAQTTAVAETAKAADTASTAIAKIGSANPIGTAGDGLDTIITKLQTIIQLSAQAKTALDRIGNAGEDGGDGIDHSKPSEDTIRFTPGGKPSMRKSGYGV